MEGQGGGQMQMGLLLWGCVPVVLRRRGELLRLGGAAASKGSLLQRLRAAGRVALLFPLRAPVQLTKLLTLDVSFAKIRCYLYMTWLPE